jgi:hypothetical protein
MKEELLDPDDSVHAAHVLDALDRRRKGLSIVGG